MNKRKIDRPRGDIETRPAQSSIKTAVLHFWNWHLLKRDRRCSFEHGENNETGRESWITFRSVWEKRIDSALDRAGEKQAWKSWSTKKELGFAIHHQVHVEKKEKKTANRQLECTRLRLHGGDRRGLIVWKLLKPSFLLLQPWSW